MTNSMQFRIILLAPILATLAMALLVAVVAVSRRRAPEPHTILHANGKPCSPGYHLVKDLFTEGDGTKEDAWVADHATPGRLSIDFLKPLESVSATVFVLPQPEQPRRKL